MNAEKHRLAETKNKITNWKKWGPYLSERQWGTVREDYSDDGEAWEFVTHDMARSRAYRWGEEGIAGICDDKQILCFGLALWNGNDPILKERMFGLNGNEGNHAEDVKEYYYYLDNTPTHSYMKMLYKYPQRKFPYQKLVNENKQRARNEPEFELIDTGIFDKNDYFDVFVEYAKAASDDILIRFSVHNRSSKKASINVIPQIWFRNSWSWSINAAKPGISLQSESGLKIDDNELGRFYLYFENSPEILFCDNETNENRLFGKKKTKGFCKDGINDYIVSGVPKSVNKNNQGTKAAANYQLSIAAGKSVIINLRLTNKNTNQPFQSFEKLFQKRMSEADAFYEEIQKELKDDDARNVQRQAFAGMLWTKQFYYFNIYKWLEGDPGQPKPAKRRQSIRNGDWLHLNNSDIISMPDKWEYPWYAAWDLAFHCLPLAKIDPEFAKQQLILFTQERYMHPNGQLPAYEWEFGDVNPPVHAWAAWRTYEIDRKQNNGKGDLDFLARILHKLLLNFTWWVNRKDEHGFNLFQGGFLGLDNIGVFNRSKKLPTGGHIEQSDGTSWMAMYCLNLLRISLELAKTKPVYQDLASKFFEHFLYIASAMSNIGGKGINLWDEGDEFFYDVLHCSDANHNSCQIVPLKVRSMVGLIPLFAVETLEPDLLENVPEFKKRMEWFLENRPELANLISRWYEPRYGNRRLLSLLRGHRLKAILKRMLDETEFLSDFGVRALSQYHKNNPYVFKADKEAFTVNYQPAESDSALFGGNSNWRGPIWFPVNYLIIESLQKFFHYYGDDFKVECPTNSGNFVSLKHVADELSHRLTRLFLRNENGERPVFGTNAQFQHDVNFRDNLLFYEYFHGDDGTGLGASHQTGWTALVAKLL